MFGLKREDNSRVKEMDKQIRAAFKSIREEMDDHLSSINDNTQEIQSLGNYMEEMDMKFEKLKERVDEIHAMLSKLTAQNNKEIVLTEKEKAVFMVLYAVEQTPLSYSDIAMRTGITELAVKAHIFGMINKGIPILERQIDGQSYFRLDKKFKELQARENILDIETDQ